MRRTMWNFSRLASLYTHQWIPVKDVWFSMTYDEQVKGEG